MNTHLERFSSVAGYKNIELSMLARKPDMVWSVSVLDGWRSGSMVFTETKSATSLPNSVCHAKSLAASSVRYWEGRK